MSEAAEKVKAAFLQLPPEEQHEIADWVYTTVESPFDGLCEDDPGFIDEINRRVANIEAGRTKLIPAEEVERRMKEKYG